ncbi:MAG: hypothetical protein U1F66_05220 [bacterium]
MKVFFRKHGNLAFYVILPVLFLVLTVAFIQFTPSVSRTAGGDPCKDGTECCNDSGCGIDGGEVCFENECKTVNLGCEEGGTPEQQQDGVCVCVNEAGQDIGQCIVCPVGKEQFIGGTCQAVCLPGQNPGANNCILLEGSGFGCSLNALGSGGSSGLLAFGFSALPLAWLRLRARRKK